jgi:hypothetical protein
MGHRGLQWLRGPAESRVAAPRAQDVRRHRAGRTTGMVPGLPRPSSAAALLRIFGARLPLAVFWLGRVDAATARCRTATSPSSGPTRPARNAAGLGRSGTGAGEVLRRAHPCPPGDGPRRTTCPSTGATDLSSGDVRLPRWPRHRGGGAAAALADEPSSRERRPSPPRHCLGCGGEAVDLDGRSSLQRPVAPLPQEPLGTVMSLRAIPILERTFSRSANHLVQSSGLR